MDVRRKDSHLKGERTAASTSKGMGTHYAGKEGVFKGLCKSGLQKTLTGIFHPFVFSGWLGVVLFVRFFRYFQGLPVVRVETNKRAMVQGTPIGTSCPESDCCVRGGARAVGYRLENWDSSGLVKLRREGPFDVMGGVQEHSNRA